MKTYYKLVSFDGEKYHSVYAREDYPKAAVAYIPNRFVSHKKNKPKLFIFKDLASLSEWKSRDVGKGNRRVWRVEAKNVTTKVSKDIELKSFIPVGTLFAARVKLIKEIEIW